MCCAECTYIKPLHLSLAIEVSLVVKTAIWFRMDYDNKYTNVMNELFKDVKNKNFGEFHF